MASSFIVLVYCESSMRALRAILPDDDLELDSIKKGLRPNEALVEIPNYFLNGRYGLDILLPIVAKEVGLNILPPVRCVIVDANGLVVDHGMIEPDLYVPPKTVTPKMQQALALISSGAESPIMDQPTPPFTVKPHDEADVGGKFNGDVYAPVIAKRAVANIDDVAP